MKIRKINSLINSFYKIILLSFILCALISYKSIVENYFTLKSYDIALAIKKTDNYTNRKLLNKLEILYTYFLFLIKLNIFTFYLIEK